jgi:NADPH2:quinone reductase
MRALLCTEFGGSDRLTVGDVAPPGAPAAGEVLIEVGAAGVNFADLLMISGQYQEKPALHSRRVSRLRGSCAVAVPASRA